MSLFRLIFDKSDLSDMKAHCECGEFEFEGDWDDLCREWPTHERDPESAYPITRRDHENRLLITREGYEILRERFPERFLSS